MDSKENERKRIKLLFLNSLVLLPFASVTFFHYINNGYEFSSLEGIGVQEYIFLISTSLLYLGIKYPKPKGGLGKFLEIIRFNIWGRTFILILGGFTTILYGYLRAGSTEDEFYKKLVNILSLEVIWYSIAILIFTIAIYIIFFKRFS